MLSHWWANLLFFLLLRTSSSIGYPSSQVQNAFRICGGDTCSSTLTLDELVDDAVANSRKIVVVTGGVLSGIGKGVTASSIGVLFRAMGLRVVSPSACDDPLLPCVRRTNDTLTTLAYVAFSKRLH